MFDDPFMENPGKYYNASSINERGYYYYKQHSMQYNAKSCLLPEGAKFLSVFTTKDTHLDENMLVFYSEGEKDVIKVVRRKYTKEPFGIYIFSLGKIEQLTKYGKPLPDIFESPYGRLIQMNDCRKEAEAGFGRLVSGVWKMAERGVTRCRDGDTYFVQFTNNEVEIATSIVKDTSGVSGPRLQSFVPFKSVNYSYNHHLWDIWMQAEDLLPPPVESAVELPKTRLTESGKTSWFKRIRKFFG